MMPVIMLILVAIIAMVIVGMYFSKRPRSR